MRKKYETDLTDKQWKVIAPLFFNMRNYKWEKRNLQCTAFIDECGSVDYGTGLGNIL